jgi:hypothetical protein
MAACLAPCLHRIRCCKATCIASVAAWLLASGAAWLVARVARVAAYARHPPCELLVSL